MRWCLPGLLVATLIGIPTSPLAGQTIELSERPFNEQTLRPFGQPVVPIFEGWYETPEGKKRICFGYLNPNTVESLDIPLGENNRIEPARWNGLQPTHFRPVPETSYRRDYCVFTIEVGDDFGPDDRIVWTLQSRGGPLSAPAHTKPMYETDNLVTSGRGDVAPEIRFSPNGPAAVGRTGMTADEVTARMGQPLDLSVWVTHPSSRSWVIWAAHQAPGTVTFSQSQNRVDETEGKATTTATFSEPGRYLLRIQSINSLGSFDFYCCWTNAYLPVNVLP